MQKVVLDVPMLWADHHVLAVRDVLLGLEGVEDVYASSAWKQVMVSFDPERVDAAAIEQCLAGAGYPVGEGAPPILAEPGKVHRDPQWAVLGFRATGTNMTDLEMSGEFRRY
jgi:copper chaperone CopZ